MLVCRMVLTHPVRPTLCRVAIVSELSSFAALSNVLQPTKTSEASSLHHTYSHPAIWSGLLRGHWNGNSHLIAHASGGFVSFQEMMGPQKDLTRGRVQLLQLIDSCLLRSNQSSHTVTASASFGSCTLALLSPRLMALDWP